MDKLSQADWIKWLNIRDEITGTGNLYPGDWENKMHLALQSECEEAQWLLDTLIDCPTLEAVQATLMEKDDPRSLVYLYCFNEFHPSTSRSQNIPLLEKSAECGNIFAQALLSLILYARGNEDVKMLRYAQNAAKYGERMAIYILGSHSLYVMMNVAESKDHYMRAASLGDHDSMEYCIESCETLDDLIRIKYICSMYAIGRINHIHMADEMTNSFSNDKAVIEFDREFRYSSRSQAPDLLELVLDRNRRRAQTLRQNARASIITWIICAKRMGFYKDVRQIVSRLLWSELHLFTKSDSD